MSCPGRVLPIVIAMVGVALTTSAASRVDGAGAENAPFTLQATCDARVETPFLRVQIANRSERPAAIVLGFTAADGSEQVVNSVQLITIRAATGADESHVYVNPRHALSPPGAPWVVSLAPGATQELELPLKDFISSMSFASFDPSLVPGARLVMDARPAATEGPHLWTGRVETRLDPCLE